MLSPIQTRRHWFRRIHLESNDEFQGGECQYETNISLTLKKNETLWNVRLRVALKSKSGERLGNYIIDVESEGSFEIHPDFPDEKAEDLVRMNGGAILYGMIREAVLSNTARSQHGPFEIPTIDARMFIKRPNPNNKPAEQEKSAS